MSEDPQHCPILIADDDPYDVQLLQNALSSAGVANPVIVFGNGADLLSYLDPAPAVRLQRRPCQPKLLFLDLRMPLVGGFEVIKKIRAHACWTSLPIVVVTGTPDPEDVARALELGADDVVLKPIDAVELDRLLTEVAPARERGHRLLRVRAAGGNQPGGGVLFRGKTADHHLR